MKAQKKSKSKNVVPYLLNAPPKYYDDQAVRWRREHAATVQTEILKPESFLPVSTGSTGRSPICFTIKSIPHSLIDGRNIFIEVEFTLQSFSEELGKWTTILNDLEEVLPLANTYCSIFEDLNVTFNSSIVENTNRDFAIKSYLQNLLFSTDADRKTWMESGIMGFDQQKPDLVSTGAALPLNLGQLRRSLVRGKKGYLAYGRLVSDILSCSEPLPDNVTVGVKLFPAKSDACLIQNKATVDLSTASTGATSAKKVKHTPDQIYRIEISDCSLYVPRITAKNITNLDKFYQYTNWKVIAYTHQSKQSMFKREIAVGETLPQKAIVAFTKETTYNGDPYTSKLAFQPCNVFNVVMKCNNRHVPNINGYFCDWENDLYGQAYAGLVTELGARDHPIQYIFFDQGYSIYGFDCTENKTGNVALDQPMRGAIELSATFDPAPNENLVVLVVLIYADRFEISKNGVYKPY